MEKRVESIAVYLIPFIRRFKLRSETIEDLCETFSTLIVFGIQNQKTAARTLQLRVVFAIGGRLAAESVHALCVFLCIASLIAK